MKKAFKSTAYPYFRSSITLGLIQNCVSFVLSLFCGYMLSALINKALLPDTGGVLLYAGLTVLALALGLPALFLLNNRQGKACSYDLQGYRESLYERMLARSISIGSEGELDVKLERDVGTVSSFMMGTVPDAIGSVIMLIGAFTLTAIADYRVALVFLFMDLLQLLPTLLYEKWARKAYIAVRRDEENYESWLVEGIRGMRTLKAYGLEKWFIGRFTRLNRRVYASGKHAEQVGTVESIVFETINAIVTYGSYIVVGLFTLLWGLPIEKIPLLIILGENLFSSTNGVYSMRVSWFSYDEAKKRIAWVTAPDTAKADGGPLLCARNITKSFNDKQVLCGASLEVGPNERVLLHGGNGSGKSTLMRIMLGLLAPDGGEAVARQGLTVSNALQQDEGMNMSGVEVSSMLLEAGQIDGAAFERISAGFGLSRELLERRLSEYSGGELKKFYLSAAFAKPADIIVLDEPTNHIDSASAEYLITLIGERSGAVLVCSHDERLLSIPWDRRVTVADGRLYG